MSEKPQKFDAWGIVEIMGHDRIAGRIQEQAVGGSNFVRVDVPAVNGNQAYTRLLGPSAIFSISLTDEETAVMAAGQFARQPMDEWSARRMLGLEHRPDMFEQTSDEDAADDDLPYNPYF